MADVYPRSIVAAAHQRALLRQQLGLTRPERTCPPLVRLVIDAIRSIRKEKESA